MLLVAPGPFARRSAGDLPALVSGPSPGIDEFAPAPKDDIALLALGVPPSSG